MKITLDTNCLINLFGRSDETEISVEQIQALIRLGMSREIDIAITTRVETDLSNDKDEIRRKQMLRNLNMFPVVGSVFRLDTSFLDGGDFLSSTSDAKLEEEIRKILFPGLTSADKWFSNKINDVDHIVGHLLNHRDIFVTDDRHLVRRAEALRAVTAILIKTPQETLEFIERQKNLSKMPQNLEGDSKYKDVNLSGTATFDYSSNNGIFIIGRDHLQFDTKWSKASDVSIHAYSDSQNVERIALAKGAVNISDISDASILDYSSRARSPLTGHIVIWRNKNGYYAATKVIRIKDDSRGAGNDEVSFEFIILSNGSANFSHPKN